MIATFLKVLINMLPSQFPWTMAADALILPYDVFSTLGL